MALSLFASLFVVLVSLQSVRAQHCQTSQVFVLDTLSQCLLSANDNLENCCFVCPVTNASGSYQFCGSMYALGYATCGQSGSLAARQTACQGIGGNINAGSFMCLLSAGTNKSQSTGYTTAMPTQPTVPTASTSTPTEAPTAGGYVVSSSVALAIALSLLYTIC